MAAYNPIEIMDKMIGYYNLLKIIFMELLDTDVERLSISYGLLRTSTRFHEKHVVNGL